MPTQSRVADSPPASRCVGFGPDGADVEVGVHHGVRVGRGGLLQGGPQISRLMLTVKDLPVCWANCGQVAANVTRRLHLGEQVRPAPDPTPGRSGAGGDCRGWDSSDCCQMPILALLPGLSSEFEVPPAALRRARHTLAIDRAGYILESLKLPVAASQPHLALAHHGRSHSADGFGPVHRGGHPVARRSADHSPTDARFGPDGVGVVIEEAATRIR